VTNNQEANGIPFVLKRPTDEERGSWPAWSETLKSVEGETWLIKPEHIWYSAQRRKYVLVVGLVEQNTGLELNCYVAAKWLSQKNVEKDEYLVCVRPKQPYRWSCVRHFFKKHGIPFSKVKNPDTGNAVRISAVINAAQKAELQKKANIYMVGRKAPEDDVPDNLDKLPLSEIMSKYGHTKQGKAILLKRLRDTKIVNTQ
jgi:hypothetical protein